MMIRERSFFTLGMNSFVCECEYWVQIHRLGTGYGFWCVRICILYAICVFCIRVIVTLRFALISRFSLRLLHRAKTVIVGPLILRKASSERLCDINMILCCLGKSLITLWFCVHCFSGYLSEVVNFSWIMSMDDQIVTIQSPLSFIVRHMRIFLFLYTYVSPSIMMIQQFMRKGMISRYASSYFWSNTKDYEPESHLASLITRNVSKGVIILSLLIA